MLVISKIDQREAFQNFFIIVIELILQELASGVSKLFPDALFYKPTQEKIVALTIDDAPTPEDPEDY